MVCRVQGLVGCARALRRNVELALGQASKRRSYFCSQALADKEQEKEDVNTIFRRKMELAGITPKDHVGIAVFNDGGSLALSLLARSWKRESLTLDEASPVDGLTGLTVQETEEEAVEIQNRVKKLGVECEVLKMPEGSNYLHSRYNILADACRKRGIGFLLSSTDADDQAAQLVVRLSLCTGNAGLAVMRFLGELHTRSWSEGLGTVFMVKPLLEIFRSQLVELCKRSGQEWIETPGLPVSKHTAAWPDTVRHEVRDLIVLYQKKRAELDAIRNKQLSDLVSINTDYGYVVLDVEKFLQESDPDVQRRILVAVMRFVRQRYKPRHRNVNKCLSWLRKKALKGDCDGSGVTCSLQPGSESNVLVTVSARSTTSVRFSDKANEDEGKEDEAKEEAKDDEANEEEAEEKAILVEVSEQTDSTAEKEPKKSTKKKRNKLKDETAKYADILQEGRTANVISESTVAELVKLSKLIQGEKLVKSDESEAEKVFGYDLKEDLTLLAGKSGYYMQRFVVSWEQESECRKCGETCFLKNAAQVQCRLFREEDLETMKKLALGSAEEAECGQHEKLQESWEKLCSLPKAVQLGLLVLTTEGNKLVGVPSVGFQVCPDTKMTIKFLPRLPLAGGTTIWV